jgi:hypothetical protein
MKITVYSITPNDDYETPLARVFGSEHECLEFIFDRLEIDREDRDHLIKLYFSDYELFQDALNEFKQHDHDSYSIDTHCVELTSPIDDLAALRPYFHAISLHNDILTNDEEHDHAWNLACGVDAIDRQLNGDVPDSYLEEVK